jgi:zinc protease
MEAAGGRRQGGNVKTSIRAAAAAAALLVAGLVTGTPVGAGRDGMQAPPAPASNDALPKVDFEKVTLPNGLQLILHVDRKLPIVHVNEWFHVGSKNERFGRTGFAHLFEHMMFQGSKNASEDYFTYVEKAGANLQEGGVNGTTNQDRTNYFATVPSGNLENLLWLESDRLATLADATTQQKLDNQRDVVKNERRQGLENQPYGRWFPLMFEAVFPSGHPYSWPTIGSQEDLTAASLDDVKEFFRTFYTPNNLSLVIAGDFDPAAAKKLVEKYFGDIPPGRSLDRPARWVPTMTSEKIVEVNDHVSLERVYLGWPTPEYFSPDDAAMDLAARVLADGLSSRLNRALVYDRQLATAVSAFNITGEIASAFVVQATARPGVALGDIEHTIAAEIARLAKEGPTAEELERAKTKQESEFVSGLERIGGFGGKADILNQYNVFLGDPGRLEADMDRYRSMTRETLTAAVARWLDTPRHATIRFHPDAATRPDNALTLDRTAVPSLGADRPFTAPSVQSAKLDNGMEVFVVERHDLPKVNVTIATRAGASTDPAGKAGVAQLTVTTMDLGTSTKKALEIEDALGALGTTLSGFSGREVAQLSLDVLTRNLSPALAIVADVVRNPTFPESEVTREQKRTLDALAQQDRSPQALAARLRPILTFGGTHPYGTPVSGLRETVSGISREDLVAYHKARWRPGSSAIIFAGDVSLEKAKALAQEHFGAWTGGAAAAATIPPPAASPGGKIYIVDRPDAAQTIVVQWLPAPPRKTPDFDALRMLDSVWGGGGFGTRLNLNLREDKGYSYGVFSNLVLYTAAGNWFASGGVQTNKTKESIVEFDNELKGLAGTKPVTAAELETAKVRWTRGYAQQFESLGRISDQIAELWVKELPFSELQRQYTATGALTLDQVTAAAKKYAKPETAGLLLVGDRSKIEAGIRGLNLGEVVVIDVEGKPVSAATSTGK